MRGTLCTLALLAFTGLSCGGTVQHVSALAMPSPNQADAAQHARHHEDGDHDADEGSWSEDLPEKEEIRKSFELSVGSHVEIRSINGSVDVETADTNMAEVLVVRSARKRADFETRKFTVEATANGLVIAGESDRGGRRPDVRARVTVKLPRSIALDVEGVNGRVRVGEIDGKILISGVNGSVNVARAHSTSSISGINGKVVLTLQELDASGLEISGVNGKVELHFAESLNAELTVDGINGNVYSEIGNITVKGKIEPSSFKGRIGEGGPMIRVTGVNGNVELLRAGVSRTGDGVSIDTNKVDWSR